MAKYISEGAGTGLVVSCVVPLFFTWCFCCVRIYVRWVMLKVWKAEDWLFVASQISSTVLAISALLSALHGNGQHLANIELTDIPIAMQFFFIGEIFYTLTTIFIRLSIGFYLLRICILKLHHLILKITMSIMSLLTFAYFIFIIVQCNPVSYFWLQFSGEVGKCLPATTVQTITISYAVSAAATDIIFGVLPIFVIWNLKMNRKAKMVVGALLALGIIAGFTVIIRIEYVRLLNLTVGFLFAVSNVSIWSMIEPAIGICCMATSTFRPLFSSLKDNSVGSYYTSNMRSGHMRTATLGSRVHGESNNFRMSRFGSTKGYLRGVDKKDARADSFEDVMAMESLESKVEGGMQGEGSGHHSGASDEEKGIMFSTTVEITRDPRKSQGDDTV